MRILAIILHCIRYSWQYFKRVLRTLRYVFWLTLPLSGFTILLALIQGIILGKWYHETSMRQPALLANNLINIKTYEWFKEPYGENPLYIPRAPYHIKQLHNPLTWAQDIGISRPKGWKTDNVGVLAYFRSLYRKSRRHSSGWHHWIYLSANEQPLNETWNEDPWDRAFLDLLEHRDEYEPQGRWNFNYITCPRSFLCSLWRVDGPALIHFTNEPLKRNETRKRSRAPILDPVHVRVFDLPLNESVIPGRFPTHFEQMRSITASNSTYWSKHEKYSNFDQVRGQALKVLGKLQDRYPKTLGMLTKVEDRWTKLTGAEGFDLIELPRILAFLAGALPSHYGARYWEYFQMWRKEREYDRSPEGKENKLVGPDPVAKQLQGFLDVLSDEDKEGWSKTHEGGIILDRVQKGLENKDWDGIDDVLADIEAAVGP